MPPRISPLPRPEELARSGPGSTARRLARLQSLPHATRILGIDPGLHRTGYGSIQLDGSRTGVALIDGGVLRAPANDPLPCRLRTLHEGLLQLLHEQRPDVAVIEELFSTYAHPRSALLMAHARGVLMLAAELAGVAVASFLPNEVKQVLTGNGHAAKSAVAAAVRSRLRLTAPIESPDTADALALALCFAMRQTR